MCTKNNIFEKVSIYNNILSKFISFSLLIFFSSCTNSNLSLNEGVRFINLNENIIYTSNKKIKLSTSYLENNNLICIYIKNDTKIIKEVSKNENCVPEI